MKTTTERRWFLTSLNAPSGLIIGTCYPTEAEARAALQSLFPMPGDMIEHLCLDDLDEMALVTLHDGLSGEITCVQLDIQLNILDQARESLQDAIRYERPINVCRTLDVLLARAEECPEDWYGDTEAWEQYLRTKARAS